MKLKHILPIVFLCSCGIFSADKKDEYTTFRILNNELGSVLENYHSNFVRYAQKEVDLQAFSKCALPVGECRDSIKFAVARKYEDREKTYNMCADIQISAKYLLDKADGICKSAHDVQCDEAKLNALDKRGAVQNAFEVVSGWITK